MPEIEPRGFKEKTDAVISEIASFLNVYASDLLKDDVVYTVDRNVEVKDRHGKDRPYIMVRGLRDEKQFLELLYILRNTPPKYMGLEWQFVDLPLFIGFDEEDNLKEYGPLKA